MNEKALKQAERRFLKRYPGGFRHPEMVAIGKKHKVEQLTAMAKEDFAKGMFADPKHVVAAMAKLVSKSSLVSMFEKPKFKRMADALTPPERKALASALESLLHGKEKDGFEALNGILAKHKLSKWTLATVLPAYFRPKKDVFVKPTTAKLIIDALELDMTYSAKPSWTFYRDFRKAIKGMRSQVSADLSPNNPAFCGFLMVSLRDDV